LILKRLKKIKADLVYILFGKYAPLAQISVCEETGKEKNSKKEE